MAYSTLPIAGINLEAIQSAAQIALQGEPADFGPLGTQTFASDGKRYVWAVAAATIAPSTTVCAINTTAFTVAATGGAYISPAVSMVSGDYGWFGTASV
jgi:uncharacterized iron-regulated membrane protein